MKKIKVKLNPVASGINLPTVITTAILPGGTIESLFIATQVGEILYKDNDSIRTFLDIRPQVIKLMESGFDERGLLGLAFHPNFNQNGLFYLHYSVAGTQGPGALSSSFSPDPCNIDTLNLKWNNRQVQYDHIDTVEEWSLINGRPRKLRTLLNLRRPFFNHNGFNSLNFSPETGKLVLTTGDGGSGYDPFNLSQNDMEIAGKIIEIDISIDTFIDNPPVVTRFNELPAPIQETLSVIAKGVRNISGVSYQKVNNQYIKYVINVGQRLVESVFSFLDYKSIPVTQIIQTSLMNSELDQEGFINFGWRGWEGDFPALLTIPCFENQSLNEKIIAYYDESVNTSVKRLLPLISYFHDDPRPDKFEGTAITGVKPYMGSVIPDLTGNILFTDLVRKKSSPIRGALAYTMIREDCKLNDFSVIDIDYNFGSEPAFYVGLGTNMNQTKLYLGVYGSSNVNDFNRGTIFEIVP